MLKATAGGGGRGIRRIDSEKDLQEQYQIARKEAMAAFNDDSVYLEKLVVNPSMWRCRSSPTRAARPFISEPGTAPSSAATRSWWNRPAFHLSPELAEEICHTAVKAAKAANYTNAGTVEFLLDGYNNYYFMEINTRLQVEHTVTE